MEKINHFTKHQYVIEMMNKDHWLRHFNEGEEVVNDFILPRLERGQDEFSDTIYHAGTKVPYHYHSKGFETFEIAKGSVDCVINGQHFIAKEGDILHIPPYTIHGFIFLEEGTIWRELFQGMDMSRGIFEKNMVNQYYKAMKSDSEFYEMYREPQTFDGEEPLVWKQEPVDHSKVFQCRTPDFAWKQVDGKGYSLKLKVAKFETDGCKEIWVANVQKGLKVEYKYPHMTYELLYVKSGQLKLTIDHTLENPEAQIYIVNGDSIIDIPPYHTYTIEVLEDAVVYNYGGAYHLERCLEDLESIKAYTPEKIDTEEKYLKWLRQYKVYATNIEFKE